MLLSQHPGKVLFQPARGDQKAGAGQGKHYESAGSLMRFAILFPPVRISTFPSVQHLATPSEDKEARRLLALELLQGKVYFQMKQQRISKNRFFFSEESPVFFSFPPHFYVQSLSSSIFAIFSEASSPPLPSLFLTSPILLALHSTALSALLPHHLTLRLSHLFPSLLPFSSLPLSPFFSLLCSLPFPRPSSLFSSLLLCSSPLWRGEGPRWSHCPRAARSGPPGRPRPAS